MVLSTAVVPPVIEWENVIYSVFPKYTLFASVIAEPVPVLSATTFISPTATSGVCVSPPVPPLPLPVLPFSCPSNCCASSFIPIKSFCVASADFLCTSFAFAIIPLFPSTKFILTPARINKTTMVTTKATRVIPFLLFNLFIFLFPSPMFIFINFIINNFSLVFPLFSFFINRLLWILKRYLSTIILSKQNDIVNIFYKIIQLYFWVLSILKSFSKVL